VNRKKNIMDGRDKGRLKKGLGRFSLDHENRAPHLFSTSLLAWSGWLKPLDFLLAPVMDFLSLPTLAALPLLIGILANIYGAIAAMAGASLHHCPDDAHGIFLLTAHNMIQEGIIQSRSGLHPR